MSERRSRTQRRLPAYVPRVLALGRALTAGSVGYLEVAHDGDCAYFDNLPCDCCPDVQLARYLPPTARN